MENSYLDRRLQQDFIRYVGLKSRLLICEGESKPAHMPASTGVREVGSRLDHRFDFSQHCDNLRVVANCQPNKLYCFE